MWGKVVYPSMQWCMVRKVGQRMISHALSDVFFVEKKRNRLPWEKLTRVKKKQSEDLYCINCALSKKSAEKNVNIVMSKRAAVHYG